MEKFIHPELFNFSFTLKVKSYGGHIDGFDPKPTDDKTDGKAITNWEVKDAQIKSWILGFVDFQFILNLRPY